MKTEAIMLFSLTLLSFVSIENNIKAQCNPTIPSTVTLIDTATFVGLGVSVFWICTTDTVESGGGGNIFFVESDGILTGEGGGLTVYLKNCASFDAGGGSNTIYYEPNANVIDTGADATTIPCSTLIFNYSNVPSNSCDTTNCRTTGTKEFFTTTKETKVNIFPNPTSRALSVDLGQVHPNVTFDLANIQGQMIQTWSFDNIDHIDLDIQQPKGIYLLHVTAGQEQSVFRIVKE